MEGNTEFLVHFIRTAEQSAEWFLMQDIRESAHSKIIYKIMNGMQVYVTYLFPFIDSFN